MSIIKTQDPAIYAAIQKEIHRQHDKLELIASENFVSPAVLEAMGSPLTNKYAEGYPGKRYYGGCEFVDEAENLARDRACQLFGADHANVQPHSGSQANLAAFFSLIKFGDKVMGMDLAHGGHLTHGSPVNFSGRFFNMVHYGVGRDGFLDMDQVESLARKEKPVMIIAGASAYARAIDYAAFRRIADAVGAKLVADIAHPAGVIAAGLIPSPVPHCHLITSTTHKTLRGPRGGIVLCRKEFAEYVDKGCPLVLGGPLPHIMAAKAVALTEANRPAFKDYAARITANARTLAAALAERGFTLATGGTDNHLMLVDLSNKDVTGKDAQEMLDAANITVNRNTIPFDTKSPFVTSGIRIGTPALTTRGMKEEEMRQVARMIARVIEAKGAEDVTTKVKQDIAELTKRFPVYGG